MAAVFLSVYIPAPATTQKWVVWYLLHLCHRLKPLDLQHEKQEAERCTKQGSEKTFTELGNVGISVLMIMTEKHSLENYKLRDLMLNH